MIKYSEWKQFAEENNLEILGDPLCSHYNDDGGPIVERWSGGFVVERDSDHEDTSTFVFAIVEHSKWKERISND